MPTPQQELRDRTKKFALRILRLYKTLPSSADAQVLGKQLVRSGTSVAANYRVACRARSKKEFISKVGVVVEEADESVFWLELLLEGVFVRRERCSELLPEARELTAIFIGAFSTATGKQQAEQI